MAQAAAVLATVPSEESLPKQEASQEIVATKENPLTHALESGSLENVIDIFHGDANKKAEAVAKLGKLEPADTVFGDVVLKIEAANDNAKKKISEADELITKMVHEALGVTQAPTAEKIEMKQREEPIQNVVQAMPVIAIGEKPSVEKIEAAKEAAEPQRDTAAEVIAENYDALKEFCGEHGLSYDPETLKVGDEDLRKLSKVERLYVQVLHAKYTAGKASLEHAEAVRAGAPDAERLATLAIMTEATAKALEAAYLDQPEIRQLAGSDANETGGSIESGGFEQGPPAAAPPTGPEGPKQMGGGVTDASLTGKEAGGTYYTPAIQTDIKTYHAPDAGGPVEKGFFGKLVGKIFGRSEKDRH